MKSLLRKFINNLIQETYQNPTGTIVTEGMISPNSVSGKYAIWGSISAYDAKNMGESGIDYSELNFLMYDYNEAIEDLKYLLKQGDSPKDIVDNQGPLKAITDNAVACMRVRPYADGMGCNSAWEVIRSAADSGLGPTMYDLIMSIAPNGLISDRSQVSADARNVWKYYANNRSSVSKDFLDPGGYTDTEYDDCSTHGARVDPLRTATRLMAVDYFESTWPSEHEAFKENARMKYIMAVGSSDGNYYFEMVSNWLEVHKNEYDLDEWDKEAASDQWYEWKIDGELELVRQLDSEFKFDDPDFLNLSYNTRYAVDSYKEMEENHYAWTGALDEWLYPGASDSIDEDGYSLHFAVRDFFSERA